MPYTEAVLGVTVVTKLLKDGSTAKAGLIATSLSVKIIHYCASGGKIGLWMVNLGLDGVRTSPLARSFLPRGLGVTDWARNTADSLNYPDMSSHVGATMQFISTEVPAAAASFYAATHDGAAHTKALWSMLSANATDGGSGGGSTNTLSLGFTVTPEGAADAALLANNRTYVRQSRRLILFVVC